MGLPFLFASPLFLCLNTQKSEYFSCSEAQACDSNKFIISEEHSSYSISNDFELYCERKLWIGFSESLFFVGHP